MPPGWLLLGCKLKKISYSGVAREALKSLRSLTQRSDKKALRLASLRPLNGWPMDTIRPEACAMREYSLFIDRLLNCRGCHSVNITVVTIFSLWYSVACWRKHSLLSGCVFSISELRLVFWEVCWLQRNSFCWYWCFDDSDVLLFCDYWWWYW